MEHREAPGACPGASGPSKVTKNGAQSEPKTLKIDPLDAARLPKRSPRAPNMESQSTRFPKMDSDLGDQKWPQNGPKTIPNAVQTSFGVPLGGGNASRLSFNSKTPANLQPKLVPNRIRMALKSNQIGFQTQSVKTNCSRPHFILNISMMV